VKRKLLEARRARSKEVEKKLVIELISSIEQQDARCTTIDVEY